MQRKILTALALLVILAGCGPKTIPVAEVTLSADRLVLDAGSTAQLIPAVYPENAANQELEWSSDTPEVACVSSTGLVTALANGTAEITVKTLDGAKSAAAAVTVTTPVSGIGLNTSALELKINETGRLTATVLPETASHREVSWSSSDPKVAGVDGAGQVTAKGNGTALITVKTGEGGFSAQASVSVTTPVAGISLDKSALNLKTGQTARLSASLSPVTASDKAVTWFSSNTKVASVNSSGLITGKSPGNAVITVQARDGSLTASAAVTVSAPQPAGTADETKMLNLVNQERQKAGLAPFKLNMKLTEVARIKSRDMIDNDYFDHTSPTYGPPFDMMREFGITYRAAAENLALHPSVESAHQGLMDSPGHRANILNPKLTEIGIGIIKSRRGYYITQMFIGF